MAKHQNRLTPSPRANLLPSIRRARWQTSSLLQKDKIWSPNKFLVFSGIAILILTVFGAFLGLYALPRHTETESRPPLIFLVSGHQYYSVNEEDEIRFGMQNSQASPVTVTLRASISGNLLVFIDQDGTNVIYDGSIQGKQEIVRKISILFPYDFNSGQVTKIFGQKAHVIFDGNINGKDIQPFELPIGIAPIPWYKQLFAGTLSTLGALVLWSLKEWFDEVKENRKKESRKMAT
jgi:hypothetical protein